MPTLMPSRQWVPIRILPGAAVAKIEGVVYFDQ